MQQSRFTLKEIRARLKQNNTEQLLGLIDILKTGRFIAARATRAPLRGSGNQRLHFLTDRYRPEDLREKNFESIIAPGGSRIITGFPPKNNKAVSTS